MSSTEQELNLIDSNEKFFTKQVAVIFVTVFIDLIGFGIVIPALPYYVEGEAFKATPFDIGLLFGAYSAMQFIFAPIFGQISDKYGRRPVLFISMLGGAIGYLFIGLAGALWMVFAGRIISGIMGANISTAQAYIADITTRENRAKGMGLFGAAFGMGFIFGPAIGGILSRYGIHVPFLFAAGLSLVNAVVLYFILPESLKPGLHPDQPVRKGRFAELLDSLRDSRFSILTIIYFLVVTAFSIMTATFSLYTIYRFGYTAEQNGYLFAYVGIMAVVMQGMMFGRAVKQFGEVWLIVLGSLILIGSLFVIPYIGPEYGGLTALLIGMAAFALGNSMASPALTSLASKVAAEHEQGKALGIMQSGASLARAVGPAIGGLLLNNTLNRVDDFTLTRTYWSAAAIMLLSFLVAVYYMMSSRDHTPC